MNNKFVCLLLFYTVTRKIDNYEKLIDSSLLSNQKFYFSKFKKFKRSLLFARRRTGGDRLNARTRAGVKPDDDPGHPISSPPLSPLPTSLA